MRFGAGGQSAATGTSPKLHHVVTHLADTGLLVRNLTDERIGHHEVVGAMVLGIGFCSKGGMSIGTPIDTMMMLTVLACIAMHCRVERIVILMGEEMASSLHGTAAKPQIRLLRSNLERLASVMEQLIPGLRLHLVSDADVFRSKGYVEAKREVRARTNPVLLGPEFKYARTQFAVFHALQKFLGTDVIKLGWTLLDHDRSGSYLLRGFRHGYAPTRWCEAVFDSFAQVLGERTLGYAYTRAALSFDTARPTVCPYVANSPHGRVLLGGRQCVEALIPELQSLPRDSARKVTSALLYHHRWLELLASFKHSSIPPYQDNLMLEEELELEREELKRQEVIHGRKSGEFAAQAFKVNELLVQQAGHLRRSVVERLSQLQESV